MFKILRQFHLTRNSFQTWVASLYLHAGLGFMFVTWGFGDEKHQYTALHLESVAGAGPGARGTLKKPNAWQQQQENFISPQS